MRLIIKTTGGVIYSSLKMDYGVMVWPYRRKSFWYRDLRPGDSVLTPGHLNYCLPMTCGRISGAITLESTLSEKLIKFHDEHKIDLAETVSDLQAAERLPLGVRAAEARPLIEEQAARPRRRGAGPQRLGDILPAVLAKLGGLVVGSTPSGEMTPTN